MLDLKMQDLTLWNDFILKSRLKYQPSPWNILDFQKLVKFEQEFEQEEFSDDFDLPSIQELELEEMQELDKTNKELIGLGKRKSLSFASSYQIQHHGRCWSCTDQI